jgi:hypothetical protein
MFSEIKIKVDSLKFSEKELRKVGIEYFLIFSVIALFMLRKTNPNAGVFAAIAAIFLFLGLFSPLSLKGIYKTLMFFAFILGTITTKIILTIVFFIVVTPLGLFLRLCKKDLLDEKIEKRKESYWKKIELNLDKSRYLKQF